MADIVNTLVHEYVHNVDWFGDGTSIKEMGHGDQSWRGKANSPPYWIGYRAEAFYRELAGLEPAPEKLVEEPFHEEFAIEPERIVG